jgi:iron complex outermembrane receptor protein
MNLRSLMRPPLGLAVVAAVSVPYTSFADEPALEEIVVRSTPLQENPLEIAQPTSVLSGDELRRQIGASLGATLIRELGVSATFFGPSASQPVIRGLGGYRVQMLQDGAASLDVSGLSQDHAVAIESVVSQQVEIVKGPAALLYGSGAAGGLVNVVTNRVPTERPESAVSGALELRGETATEERTGAFSLDGGFGAVAFHADYFDRETDDFEIPGYAQSPELRRRLADEGESVDSVRDVAPNTASDSRGGALGASLVGEGGYAGLSWSRYENVYGLPAEETAFVDMEQDRFDARGAWVTDGDWLDALRISAAYNDYTHSEFEAPGKRGTLFNQDAYDLRLAADHHWSNDWRGTAGVQFADIDFEAIGEEAFVPASRSRSASVFVFEERHFDDWTIELGARAEQQEIDPANESGLADYDETAFNIAAGFVYDLADDRSLALNVTRTERHPQPAELYADGPHIGAGRYEIGDAGLGKESALTADLTLRGTGDGVRWTLSAFYNDYSEFVYAEPTGDLWENEEEPGEFLPVVQYTQAAAKLYGYEAEVMIPLGSGAEHDFELRLASDYVRGKLDDGRNLPQMPPLRVGVGLHYDRGPLHAGIQAFHSLEQDEVIEDELPTGNYTMLDVDLSYRLPFAGVQLLLFLSGTNLLDEDARLSTASLKDILPLPGRSLRFGARAEF